MTTPLLTVDLENTGSFSSNFKVMGLIGPSGSGKTTLVEQIAGLRPCGHGIISLDGTELLNSDKNINLAAEKREIGFMFQDNLLFPHMTVAENISFPAKIRALDLSDMSDLVKELGIEALLGKYPHQISGGEQQRVCLARAILSRPTLLILDEPTTGLDPKLRDSVLNLLRQSIKHIDCPILLITHYLDDIVNLCDGLTVMANNKIVASGPLADILSQPDIQPYLGYREIITEIEGGATVGKDDILKLEAGSVRIRLENDQQKAKRRRIRIRARDVAIALKEPADTSLQNILPGVISSIFEHGPNEVLVSISLGIDGKGPELKSLITVRSKKDLQLTAGFSVYALINAVAVQSPL